MLEAVNENWTTCFGCNLGEATTFLGLVLPPPLRSSWMHRQPFLKGLLLPWRQGNFRKPRRSCKWRPKGGELGTHYFEKPDSWPGLPFPASRNLWAGIFTALGLDDSIPLLSLPAKGIPRSKKNQP